MNIAGHEEKIRNLEKSLAKLGPEDDYEAVIELSMLIAAHHLNTAFHEKGLVTIEQDIKHNKLVGFLLQQKLFGEEQEKVIAAMRHIEELRPSRVYGRGKNGKSAEKALQALEIIKHACGIP